MPQGVGKEVVKMGMGTRREKNNLDKVGSTM